MPNALKSAVKKREPTEPLKWIKKMEMELGRLQEAEREVERFLRKFELVGDDERIEVTQKYISHRPFVELRAKVCLHEWMDRLLKGVDSNVELIMANTELPLGPFPEEELPEKSKHLFSDPNLCKWFRQSEFGGLFEKGFRNMQGSPCKKILTGGDYIYLVYRLRLPERA